MTGGRGELLRGLCLSLAIHLGAAAMLSVSIEFDDYRTPAPPPARVMEAVAVDQRQVEAELAKLRERETAQRREREARAAELERLEREREALEKEKREEQQRLERLQAQRKAEDEKRRKAEAERERIEREKREAAAERERIEREKREAAAERKRQEEERRAAEEQARRERELREQLEAEARAREAAERAEREQGIVSEYAARIKARIQGVFINPAPEQRLSCVIRIRMIPGGDVVFADIVRSSGNAAFDRQAEIAVHKAAPLPVPDDPRIFARMREIDLVFDVAE